MVKEGMGLGEIISRSFKEFGENWKTFLGILIILSFIPSIILLIIEIFWMKSTNYFTTVMSNDFSKLLSSILNPLGIIFIILAIIVFFIGIWMYASILYNSLYKKKSMGIRESLAGGGKYFWKILGLILLLILILVIPILLIIGIVAMIAVFGGSNIGLMLLLTVLLIVGTICYVIFAIYLEIKWMFSFYILIAENKGVIDSLRVSSGLVKGRWWKTLGYTIVIGLIIMGISLVFSIPAGIINMGLTFGAIGSTSLETGSDLSSLGADFINMMIISMIISFIFNLLAQIIITPLSILMGKNLYLSWKASKK